MRKLIRPPTQQEKDQIPVPDPALLVIFVLRHIEAKNYGVLQTRLKHISNNMRLYGFILLACTVGCVYIVNQNTLQVLRILVVGGVFTSINNHRRIYWICTARLGSGDVDRLKYFNRFVPQPPHSIHTPPAFKSGLVNTRITNAKWYYRKYRNMFIGVMVVWFLAFMGTSFYYEPYAYSSPFTIELLTYLMVWAELTCFTDGCSFNRAHRIFNIDELMLLDNFSKEFPCFAGVRKF